MSQNVAKHMTIQRTYTGRTILDRFLDLMDFDISGRCFDKQSTDAGLHNLHLPTISHHLWGRHKSVPLGARCHEHPIARRSPCRLFANDQIIRFSESNPLDHWPCLCPSCCNHCPLHVGWKLGLQNGLNCGALCMCKGDCKCFRPVVRWHSQDVWWKQWELLPVHRRRAWRSAMWLAQCELKWILVLCLSRCSIVTLGKQKSKKPLSGNRNDSIFLWYHLGLMNWLSSWTVQILSFSRLGMASILSQGYMQLIPGCWQGIDGA